MKSRANHAKSRKIETTESDHQTYAVGKLAPPRFQNCARRAKPPPQTRLRLVQVALLAGARVAMLKVDVEGLEMAVLQGGKGLFAAGRVSRLLVEVSAGRWASRCKRRRAGFECTPRNRARLRQ